ncbi:outer membrane lipoprotein-sorting protein [Desulfobulbus rhabdoformis]|uniref:outer membrane lipoprotein-sorting protein n=1 Tax=Desulfobulbus rhabdoformis TaxID=34032 RepID=UPI0019667557|nr:outer membrane lipoprotein-sorting protein [Desulfobulbus rhabdoformis]MBM9616921.1 outer membrane lipoprotein-sorting protein [Desulfobulbus rhabdoformis]
MRKKLCLRTLFVSMAALCCLSFTVTGEELDGRQIMVLADERPDGDDRHSIMKMTLINKRGRQRIREVEQYSKDYGKDTKSVMVFEQPADVKGTAFLSWDYDNPVKDDDKWLYMPAMKKVRRISGSSTNEYFMGTDFTYDDMGDRNVDEDTHTLLGKEKIDGRDCWKIESIPVDKQDMYTRKIIWVDQEGHFSLKTEYYDKDGLLKIYRALVFKRQDGFWTTFKSEMDNVSREHRTIMETSSMQYDTGIKNRMFKVSTIQRGRIR